MTALHNSEHDHHPHSHHRHDAHNAHELNGLRLALGSILNPKRYPTPHSSTSGSASPHPHGFGPSHGASTKDSHSPSSPAPSTPHVQVPPNSAVDRWPISRANSESVVPLTSVEHKRHDDELETTASTHETSTAFTTVTNIQATKRRQGYIATLQSKSAWDALIHGSFT